MKEVLTATLKHMTEDLLKGDQTPNLRLMIEWAGSMLTGIHWVLGIDDDYSRWFTGRIDSSVQILRDKKGVVFNRVN